MDDAPHPPGTGWQPYIDATGGRDLRNIPLGHLYRGAVLELWRQEWGARTYFTSLRHHPAQSHMNVAGLYWRIAT